ncbi:DUF5343 domain-containing protein [Fodinibius sp.]|uniref:DUF5343 domain-containing protein n=1 Tax=Fodinibius sp. TaxID=1872440 RepID=UPI002ACD254D|nr:DUF5343 domain-containing protein [Fodinibius sp.]MDZ7659827.1 DUF5343 domain-containing protein [Fodinibius sp.]
MKVSEAFLVNTKNFAPIIETLVNYEDDDIVVNSDLLERLSYSDPNDLLVIRILKDFSIIDNDGKPGKYFEEFKNPETTKIALAKGLFTAYEGIFDQHPKIHQQPPEKIKEVFENHFKDKKTDLIIKYISGTFEKIVSHVGVSTIDKVLNEEIDKEKVGAEVAAVEASEKNGNSTGNEHTNNHTDSDNKDQQVKREEISENNIDDFLSSFESSDSENNSFDIPNKQSQNSPDNKNQEDDPSVQEFIKNIEEETNMSTETKEKNEQNSEPEELSDTLEDIEEKDSKEIDDSDDLEDGDNLSFEKDEQSSDHESDSTSSEADLENKNTDIPPIDLEVPMSHATKSTNAMQNVTEEHQFVKKALLRKSDLLHKMKRWEELVPTLEEIINRYDNEENVDFKEAVERSVIRRAIAFLKLDKDDKALPALNSVISRFKDSDNNEFYEQASRAMLFKANILEKKNASSDELLPLYNTIINRLDSNSELLMKEKLDEIHCRRFDLILDEDDTSVLLDASEELINRFKDTNKHQEYLQKAMIIRAETLDEMGEDEAALEAYDEFLKRFGN